MVVANRLPVDRVLRSDGTSDWRTSPGGLVTALEPVLRAQDGVWIGWPGSSMDDYAPFEANGLHLVPIELTDLEVQEYYEGMSNGTLWPLYHDVVAKPEFHREWWEAYVQVNQRFADAAVEAAAKDGVVWVHDYQLQLVPAMLRSKRARPEDRLLPAHPVPADGAVQAAPVARPDPRRAARGRPGRLPAARGRGQLRPARPRTSRAQDAPRQDQPRRRPDGRGPGLPDLDRRDVVREARRQPGRRGTRRRDPRRARRPHVGAARRRPARLHQRHPATAARIR